MQQTIIIYEGVNETTEKIVKKISLILGPSKYCTTTEFEEVYKNGDLFVIACPVEGEKVNNEVSKFILNNASWLVNKKVGLICTGAEGSEGIKALKKLQSLLGNSVIHCKTIRCEQCDNEIAQFSLELKRIRESFLKLMPREELKKEIDSFIYEHKCCDLATGYNDWIRSTPVEYIYKNGFIYIISEGGKKFANIILNNRVSISIFNKFESIRDLEGIQIRGKATILDEKSEEYNEILDKENIVKEYTKNSFTNLNCIRINFDKIEYLNSKFKKMGYDTKQIYYYK